MSLVILSQRSDSRLTSREAAAVTEWLEESGLPFHILRDHPGHQYGECHQVSTGHILSPEILGGLWGARLDTGYRTVIQEAMRRLIENVIKAFSLFYFTSDSRRGEGNGNTIWTRHF